MTQLSDSPSKKLAAYLLYDSNCGPCTKFKDIVIRLDMTHRLIPIPLQSDLAYELVRSQESRAELMQAFHIVYARARPTLNAEQQETVFSAGDALIQLIRLLPLGSMLYWVITHFRPLRRLIRWTYTRIAQFRAVSVSCKTP